MTNIEAMEKLVDEYNYFLLHLEPKQSLNNKCPLCKANNVSIREMFTKKCDTCAWVLFTGKPCNQPVTKKMDGCQLRTMMYIWGRLEYEVQNDAYEAIKIRKYQLEHWIKAMKTKERQYG